MKKQERNTSFLQAVGRRLRQLREATGLSQEKVQFKTGIYLVYLETGQRNITLSALLDLCQVYGVTLEEFFAGMEFYDGQPLPRPAEPEEPDASAMHNPNDENGIGHETI